VPPRADMAVFAPKLEGYPNGFDLSVRGNHKNAKRIYDQHLHVLVADGPGRVDEFTALMQQHYEPALRMDLTERSANNLRNVQRQDTNVGAYWMLHRRDPAARELTERFQEVCELLNVNEAQNYHLRSELANLPAR
jgi:glycine cleavage system regulatory protein